ncbi:MAG: ATP-binding protein [Parabacteroides sp.]|nr:ATP-binding protein [Parabacteroides sp.]
MTVSDNGIGISPEEQSKVFEKFYRSTHLPDKQIPGIGLGLSYVRQIVEAHQGSVSLQSKLGKGTRITVSLPAATDNMKSNRIE